MGYHNLLSKTDKALAAYLISMGAGESSNVYPAKLSVDKDVPCTICYAKSATPLAQYSGTYLVKAEIQVKTSACVDVNQTSTTPVTDSDLRTSEAFDAFHREPDPNNAGEVLAQEITTAARSAGVNDFTCLNVSITEVESGTNDKGDVWVDTLNLELVCCPADNIQE